MFPLGVLTGKLQAAREAEAEIYVLLLACRLLPEHYQSIQLKYVAVAVLAFTDSVNELGAEFMARQSKRKTLDTDVLQYIKAASRKFHKAADPIDGALRRSVRNTVAAHRVQQTIASVSRTHDTVWSPLFPEYFEAARSFVDVMEECPVWHWGYRVGERVVGQRGSKRMFWEDTAKGPEGFSIRLTSGAGRMDPEGDPLELASEREAHKWVDSQ